MPIKFIKGFVARPFTTGAIAPSSASLAKEILRYWPEEKESVIVEYGPGTGAITKKIIEKIIYHKFVSLELNLDFFKHLKKDFPEVAFFNDSAEALPSIIKKESLDKASLVISGLPWAMFNNQLQKSILDVTHANMKSEGVFSTFAYVHALKMKKARHFSRLLNSTFEDVKISKVVWKNIPPAIIYHCSKTKGIL